MRVSSSSSSRSLSSLSLNDAENIERASENELESTPQPSGKKLTTSACTTHEEEQKDCVSPSSLDPNEESSPSVLYAEAGTRHTGAEHRSRNTPISIQKLEERPEPMASTNSPDLKRSEIQPQPQPQSQLTSELDREQASLQRLEHVLTGASPNLLRALADVGVSEASGVLQRRLGTYYSWRGRGREFLTLSMRLSGVGPAAGLPPRLQTLIADHFLAAAHPYLAQILPVVFEELAPIVEREQESQQHHIGGQSHVDSEWEAIRRNVLESAVESLVTAVATSARRLPKYIATMMKDIYELLSPSESVSDMVNRRQRSIRLVHLSRLFLLRFIGRALLLPEHYCRRLNLPHLGSRALRQALLDCSEILQSICRPSGLRTEAKNESRPDGQPPSPVAQASVKDLCSDTFRRRYRRLISSFFDMLGASDDSGTDWEFTYLQDGGAVAVLENADSLMTLENALQQSRAQLAGQRAQYPDVELLLNALEETAATCASGQAIIASASATTSDVDLSQGALPWTADMQLDKDLPPVLALEALQRRLASGALHLKTQQQERNSLTSEIRRQQRALRATNHTLQILQRKLDQLHRDHPAPSGNAESLAVQQPQQLQSQHPQQLQSQQPQQLEHVPHQQRSRPPPKSGTAAAAAAISSDHNPTMHASSTPAAAVVSSSSSSSSSIETIRSSSRSLRSALGHRLSPPTEPYPDDDGNPDLVLDPVPSHNYYRNLSANPRLSAAFYGKERLVALFTESASSS